MSRATALQPGDGPTSWALEPEAGYPASLALWLWIRDPHAVDWCFPTRLASGAVHPQLAAHAPGFLPDPLPAITGAL